jgi:hypothetical protein
LSESIKERFHFSLSFPVCLMTAANRDFPVGFKFMVGWDGFLRFSSRPSPWQANSAPAKPAFLRLREVRRLISGPEAPFLPLGEDTFSAVVGFSRNFGALLAHPDATLATRSRSMARRIARNSAPGKPMFHRIRKGRANAESNGSKKNQNPLE